MEAGAQAARAGGAQTSASDSARAAIGQSSAADATARASAATHVRQIKRRSGPARLPFYVRPLVWLVALTPATILLVRFFLDDLGANPIEKITNWTGYWTLCLLTATLAVTPVRRFTGYNPVIKLRRLIGLFAFFYATLHFLTYLVLDQFFAWPFIVEDILERPYITVGFTAFVLMIPLAVTSTTGWIRRLGKRWTQLHRLIYVIVPLAILHFYWKVISKAFMVDVLVFTVIVGVLLSLRVPARKKR